MQPEDVVRLLDETSHAIQFNRELLRAALENLSQGVSVVDANLCLVAWNQRYVELFDYPPGLVNLGRPIEDLMRFNATRGWLVSEDIEKALARRLSYMRAGQAYIHERELPGGTVLEIQGNPMPGGGFVTSFSEITAANEPNGRCRNPTRHWKPASCSARVSSQSNVQLADARSRRTAPITRTRFLAAVPHTIR
jgi:PAS domain-containing protein